MPEQFEHIEIYSPQDTAAEDSSMLAIYNPNENNNKPLVVYVPTYKKRFIAMTFIAISLLLFLIVRPNTTPIYQKDNQAKDPLLPSAYEIIQIPPTEPLRNVASNAQKEVDKPAQRSIPKQKIINIAQPPLEILSNSPENFNLWTIDDKYRDALLYLQYQRQQNNTISTNKSKYAEIASGKDAQTEDFFAYYESKGEVYDWTAIQLRDKERQLIKIDYSSWLEKRRNINKKYIDQYRTKLMGKNGYMHQDKGIKNSQFLDALDYHSLVGQDTASSSELQKIAEKEIYYYEQKYQNSEYKDQLRACIVVPTYNNAADQRYVWNIESIIQQNYSNYRIIIVDDASNDATLTLAGKYLKWRKADPQKWIIVKSIKHRTAMENIYYATHKYCGYREIFYILDGDDQFLGRQVLKTFNAIYQKERIYTLYSQFLIYNHQKGKDPVSLGISQNYPAFITKINNYRWYKHAYGHLRTMISDLFLLTRAESMQNDRGEFYWILYDNALYYPALEMSCQKVEYIPQLMHWYNGNTGVNDYIHVRSKEYSEAKLGIDREKPYRCIEEVFRELKRSKA